MQPGGGVSVSTQLSEKGLFITVDGDGGLFLLSVGHPGAHVLVSGSDWMPGGSGERNSTIHFRVRRTYAYLPGFLQ